MTYLRLAYGLILSLAAGYFLADLLLRKIHLSTGLKACLGIGLGFGFTSLVYFTWRLLAAPDGLAYFLAELVLVAGIGLAWFFTRRQAAPMPVIAPPKDQSRLPAPWEHLLTGSLLLAAVLAGAAFLSGALVFPHGGWDAWAIWNLAGRFLFSGPADWRLMFDPSIFHSDYPLLLGSSAARLWMYRSVVDFYAPALVGLLYALGTFGLLLSLANLARGRLASRLAGLALLGSGSLLVIAPTQCADLPLGYYLLGALGMLGLHRKTTGTGLLLTAGIFLGLGTWTKNEGWLLAIAVLLGWLAPALLLREDRPALITRLRQTGWLLVGLAPLGLFSLIQKWFLAPANDLVAAQGGETLARLVDPARWLQIGREFGVMLFSLEPKYSAPLGLLALLVIIFGVRRNAFRQPETWTNLITLALVLGGYFLVYLTTPHSLDWHLGTSLFRLYAQLWPSAVLTLILLIRLPGEEIQRSPEIAAPLPAAAGD